MTDFTVVVVFRLVIRDGRNTARVKRSAHEQRLEFMNAAARDDVLMLVMGKLNHELTRADRITKSKASIMTRRHRRVADATDNRACASEKLRPVTTHARIMTGIIGDIGEVSDLFPVFSGRFMAGVAGGLVFGCRMGKA